MHTINTQEFDLIHESISHGDMRFHLMVHEFATDPSRAERVSSHWHEECELLMLTEGRGTAHINGQAFPVSSGDILFINTDLVHSLSGEPGVPLVFFAVDFGRELLSSYGNDDIQQNYILRQSSGALIFRSLFRPGDKIWTQIRGPLCEIRSLCTRNVSGSELLIKSDLLRIWHFLCQSPASASAPDQRRADEKSALTKEILQYLRANYSSNPTIPELAGRFHMSEGQFCRFFRAQVNMTAMEYLNYYRIGIACDLLRQSNASISTIAVNCGYSNISYFNRVFRRYMHCTPKEYRQKDQRLLHTT